MNESARRELLTALIPTWPREWRFVPAAGEAPPRGHPLERTVGAFLSGRPGSLPYFKDERVHWITVAPTPEELRAAIDSVEAWVLNSFAWDNGLETSVRGGLGQMILGVSPPGYFRWTCPRATLETVCAKLEALQRLEERRPAAKAQETPSLVELRQRFVTALLAGAQDAAEECLRLIDRDKLDTAANALFMRIRLLAHFREWHALAALPQLPELGRMRVPHSVRVALVQAVHFEHLAMLEAEQGANAAAAAYGRTAHEVVGGHLLACSPADGLEVKRCLAYRAYVLRDAVAAVALLPSSDDFIAPLLRPLVPATLPRAPGGQVAELDPAPAPPRPGTERGLVVTNWGECVPSLRNKLWPAVREFLQREDGRPSAASLPSEALCELLDVIEEHLTDPELSGHSSALPVVRDVLLMALGDLRQASNFPSPVYGDVYPRLLELFTEWRKGSVHQEDIALFLLLGEASLQCQPGVEGRVLRQVERWWQARPIAAAQAFLLEALGLAVVHQAEPDACLRLWTQAADVLSQARAELSRAERRAWAATGRRLGLDEESVEASLPAVPATAEGVDLLATAGLRKVAIVSRRKLQAEEAAQQIRLRARADVVVVADDVAGAATRNAATADAVLLVWSTISHAVYRAFDGVRDKLVYVPGTGAESILLALERALFERQHGS